MKSPFEGLANHWRCFSTGILGGGHYEVNESALEGYVGMNPSEDSSGSKQRLGHRATQSEEHNYTDCPLGLGLNDLRDLLTRRFAF